MADVLASICRTCLIESESLLSLFNIVDNENNIILSSMLQQLTNLIINEDDDLPQTVCEDCADQITKAFSFRQQCIDSDLTIRKTFEVDYNSNNEVDNKYEVIATEIKEEEVDYEMYEELEMNNVEYIDYDADMDLKEEYTNGSTSKDSHMFEELEILDNGNSNDVFEDEEYPTEENSEITNKYKEEEINSFINKIDFDQNFMKNYEELSSYRCFLCYDEFEKMNELKLHLESHLAEPQYECKICSVKFRKARLYRHHLRIHLKDDTSCYHCRKEFQTTEAMNKHFVTHELEIEGQFLCYFCENQYKRTVDRKRHVIIKHTGLYKMHKDKLDLMLGNFEDDSKKLSVLCDICGKECHNQHSLKLHLVQHTGEKPFRCEICGKSFATEVYLKDHFIRHNAEKPFKCDMCSKSFARKRALKDHIKRHAGDRPFECHICNIKLAARTSLQMHIRTHSGEKPYREQESRRAPRIRTKKKPSTTSHR